MQSGLWLFQDEKRIFFQIAPALFDIYYFKTQYASGLESRSDKLSHISLWGKAGQRQINRVTMPESNK